MNSIAPKCIARQASLRALDDVRISEGKRGPGTAAKSSSNENPSLRGIRISITARSGLNQPQRTSSSALTPSSASNTSRTRGIGLQDLLHQASIRFIVLDQQYLQSRRPRKAAEVGGGRRRREVRQGGGGELAQHIDHLGSFARRRSGLSLERFPISSHSCHPRERGDPGATRRAVGPCEDGRTAAPRSPRSRG